ncbi:uncharacterized protein MAM_00128 [Metarhizium album ARSEF 1941]|uniref:Integral membrane protein n=1 Tax=Metarhizium album (strain ARSEF 1941) TaxID=1081103 RepID=A0A0B2WXW4_METAS|nr:uncharacterized protein MAM_00128 [Metarhizium album ARSEF 1941]KHO01127.1 integral membrane protein [Metarhizium album ARSEF 1941]
MLSIARSRITLVVQFAFLAVNALGVFLSALYNNRTQDLYPNNSHHKIGWIITAFVSAQVLIRLMWRQAGGMARRTGRSSEGGRGPVFHMNDCWQRVPMQYQDGGSRPSNDSGQGTEPGTESLRSDSLSTLDMEDMPLNDQRKNFDGTEAEPDFRESAELTFLSPDPMLTKTKGVISSRMWVYSDFVYKVIDRIILPFGFIALTTGIVTFGRFFEGKAIFSGLAHWIKGGVFFWLGLLSLGRWTGSFADMGWAWNIRPFNLNEKPWFASAEFIESALIFFYGSTNIFLEHLGSWGGGWSSQDLEHLAITVLFLGGGICGMLIESSTIRSLLNTTASGTAPEGKSDEEVMKRWESPDTYQFSLNPIPALVILLLGIMMSSHHQETEISTMVHKQWGDLLLGASFARVLTYFLLFLRPPKSVLPSRPPTELLTSFGLIAGGIIFMASSSDTIEGMIHYHLDAMFMYTITMGLVGLLMAWEIFVLALKGWATRREQRTGLQSLQQGTSCA